MRTTVKEQSQTGAGEAERTTYQLRYTIGSDMLLKLSGIPAVETWLVISLHFHYLGLTNAIVSTRFLQPAKVPQVTEGHLFAFQ